MKYMRKTPVEAIQKSCCAKDDYSDLIIAYEDRRGRKFKTVIPLFGWVVREGKTFQFYKDATFRKTFEEVPDDEHEEITDSIIKDVNQILEDVRASIENGQMFAKYYNLINPYGRLTKLIDDLYKADEKTREEIKKNMDECLKEMAGSDTHNATFESVLDEMKELHAKKDKDYSGSFHNLFKEYGMPYALCHIEEKLNRVKAIIANGGNAVTNEHVEDSLIDGACYNILTLIELRNRKH